MAHFNATHEAVIEEDRLERARLVLRNSAQRADSQYGQQREHDRMAYNGRPVLALEMHRPHMPVEMVTFEAHGLDISRSGLSFLLPALLSPCISTEDHQVLRVDRLFQAGHDVTVGMLQNDGYRMWMGTRIVGLKPTHEQLYHVSVRFTGRRAGLLV